MPIAFRVRGRDELAHDLATFGLHRVQGHALLVAVHLHEPGPVAALGDRARVAVLAAVDLLDADHLGSEVGQHRGAERSRDVAAEVDHPYPVEHHGHIVSPLYAR
jgi:hypothetical protein